eukprot:CCRYP_015427-RA/>CCRYP_015427-RA protein AED:0.40 eAED:0.40 QI:0/0/0/1/0/0/3/0/241
MPMGTVKASWSQGCGPMNGDPFSSPSSSMTLASNMFAKSTHNISLQLYRSTTKSQPIGPAPATLASHLTGTMSHVESIFPCLATWTKRSINSSTPNQRQLKMHRFPVHPLNMAPKLSKNFIQLVCGKFLFLGRVVDPTLLCPISAIASQFDASYLSEPGAHSRSGGHFFLSSSAEIPPNNGAILNIGYIIKHIMAAALKPNLLCCTSWPGRRSSFASSWRIWAMCNLPPHSKLTTLQQKAL